MKNVNPLDALSTGMVLTKEHFIVSLGLLLAFMVLSGILSLINGSIWLNLLSLILMLFVEFVWSLGMIRITVNAVDGEDPHSSAFKEILPKFGSYLFIYVILTALHSVPFILTLLVWTLIVDMPLGMLDVSSLSSLPALWIFVPCIVWSLYLSIRLTFVFYLLVDRGLGAVESLKQSWKATEHIQGKILLFMLLSIGLTLMGLICFIVGVLLSALVLLYAQAALYRQVFSAGIQEPLVVEDNTRVAIEG